MVTLKSTTTTAKIIWLWACLLLTITLFETCKKKDPKPDRPPTEATEGDLEETEQPPENVETVAAGKKSELIYIPYDQPLDTGRIEGLLEGHQVVLFYQPDSGLMLQIPFDSEPGVAKLTIPSIAGFETHIKINEVELPGSAGSVISALLGEAGEQVKKAQAGVEGDSTTRLKTFVDELQSYIANASEPDKARFATFYHVNRDWFEVLLQGVIEDASAAELAPVGAELRSPGNLLQAIDPRLVTADAGIGSGWTQLRSTGYSYALKLTAERFLSLAEFIRTVAYQGVPERAAATLMAMMVGEYTTAVLENALQSRPIVSGVDISDNPKAYTWMSVFSGDQYSSRDNDNTDAEAADFTECVLGNRDTLYFGLAIRSITASDRAKTNRVHGQEHSNYLGIESFFNGLDAYVEAAHLINGNLAILKRQNLFSFTEPFQSYFGLHGLHELRMPMPEWMIRQHVEFNIGKSFQATYHGERPGMTMLTLNYAEGYGPSHASRDGYSLMLAYKDDFSDVVRSGLVGILFPKANRIDLAIANDEPPRLTVPHGRLALTILPTVYPAQASQEVRWRITKGANLATIDATGTLRPNDDGKLGYVTVRATAEHDSSVYAEMSVKVTSYELNYIGGDDQEMATGSGHPKPVLFSILDKLDKECLYDPTLTNMKEKIQVKMSSPDLEFNDVYSPYFYRYYDNDGDLLPCWLSNYGLLAKSSKSIPYKIDIKVELLQDGHVIDTHMLHATVTR